MHKPQSAPLSGGLRLFAPAKINWVLTVTRRRPDGYHDLSTVFQTLQWGDQLRCRPLAKRVCRIQCADPSFPLGEENLIWRAWRLLADLYPGRVGGLSVQVDKAHPARSRPGRRQLRRCGGPGGRQSHLRIWGSDRPSWKNMPPPWAATAPSSSGAVRALGLGPRGKNSSPSRNRLGPLWLVVVYPGFHSSTRQAYAQIRPRDWSDETKALAGGSRHRGRKPE